MNIVIIGAGFGGITTALELAGRSNGDASVTLIDRATHFYMGLTKLWVATGLRTPEECLHPRSKLARDHVRFVNGEVTQIDLDRQVVVTSDDRVSFDRLVIACGLEVRPEAVPGLSDHGLNLYSMEGAATVHKVLQDFDGGKITILICAPPYKCPPAPYEAAMLIDDLLRKKGVREKTTVEIATPEPRPLPVLPTETGQRVAGFLAERGIESHAEHKAVSIEPGRIVFEGKEPRGFDLLIAVPPHKAPAFVQSLDSLTAPSGMIKVDRATLRTGRDGVFAIGDVAAVMTHADAPIPRAGVFAEGQGKVVAANIAAELRGAAPSAVYDGRGYCFLEVGGGKAMKVEGEFLAQPKPTAQLAGDPNEDSFLQKQRFESERVSAWFGS